MMMRQAIFGSIAFLAFTACSAPSGGGEAQAPATDEETAAVNEDTTGEAMSDPCGAEGYQSLLGANITAVTLPAELNHRIIAPDAVVTMDYNPERLNIYTDENGTITEVKCG